MCSFYGFVTVRIAANGIERKVKAVEGVPVMIRQIYMDYHLPILPEDLTMAQVHFFYDALIPGLIKIQKQEKEGNKNGRKV